MRFFYSLLILLGSYAVSAQQPVSKMTLRECIDYALQNNITVQQAQNVVEGNLVTARQSKAERLPTLMGFTGLNGNMGRNIDPFTNGVVTQTIGTNNLGVGLSLPIYQGSRLRNTIERDQISLQASQTDVEVQKNDVALQVAMAYLNLLSTEDLIEISKKQLEVTLIQYDKTKKMVNSGALSETQLYDLEAQIANDELSIINAENNRESAFLALKRTMNAPMDMRFEADRFGLPDPSLIDQTESVGSIYDTAIQFLPEFRASRLRMSMANKNIDLARSVGLPTLSLSTNWGSAYSSLAQRAADVRMISQPMNVSAEFEGQTIPFIINFPQTDITMESIPYFNQLGNNQNVSLGLSLNIPIFNRNATKYQTQAAMIQKRQTELQNKAAEIQVKQNIDQAYLDVMNARKKYTATLAQVEAFEKSFSAADRRYNVGAGTYVDYNLAKTNLDQARTNLVLAKYDFIFKSKILDFYQNKPLEF